ncbi:MAG TPA: N-6 DNA methylase [Fimbriimonadaceae bacterium]|nr:N-6 DNA methylase [Fimbriimonadaceae bacterium]
MAYSSLCELHAQDLRTEAEVETRLLAKLFSHLGYPELAVVPKQSVPPLLVHSGSRARTLAVDFLLRSSTGAFKVVVEAKDPSKNIQEAWGQAASYALSYNRDKSPENRIEWLLISNGHLTSLFRHDSNIPNLTLQLSDFVSGSPPFASLRSLIKYRAFELTREHNGLEFYPISPAELNALFEKCHDLVWKKEKLTPTDAFFEFCKFIFLKIRADRERLENSHTPSYQLPLTSAWLDAQKKTSAHPVKDLFAKLVGELEEAISSGKKRIFEPHEQFRMTAVTTRELVQRFENVDLSSIDEDLNGRMFEVFLNAAVRGKELGQYFTPRPLVDFITRIALYNRSPADDAPKVIDACCGTAGFLIEVMAYLLASVKADTRLSSLQLEEREKQIKEQSLYGVDANERVTRIARINMYLHGDGGSHIFNCDGLDLDPQVTPDMNQERSSEYRDYLAKVTESSFDLVLSNPPFSMSYSRSNDDEERILEQLVGHAGQSVKSNVLFLRRYHDLLKPGGEMLIVLDDTILNGKNHESFRVWLLEKFVLLGVHSMPFNAFFKAGANIKTSVIHVRKRLASSERQSHVFMSVSNNIGHNNSLADTPDRNNLNDILNSYLEWQRTGRVETVVRDNADRRENLECPEQIWLVGPEEITAERIDAFYYCPELRDAWAKLDSLSGTKRGRDFRLRRKLRREDKMVLRDSGEVLRYIEIGDVTRYGLITKFLELPFSELPTRGEYRVKSGDVLVAINNSSRGTVVLVPEEFDGAICTSGFLVIEPRSEEEGLLLWYSLRSEICRKQFYYLAQTASQPEIKLEYWLNEFRVPLPVGSARAEALRSSKEFHRNVSALLDADSFRYSL